MMEHTFVLQSSDFKNDVAQVVLWYNNSLTFVIVVVIHFSHSYCLIKLWEI